MTSSYTETINGEKVSTCPPPGSITAYLGNTEPDGWIIADGTGRSDVDKYSRLTNMGIGVINNDFQVKYIKFSIHSKFPFDPNWAWDSVACGRIVFFNSSSSYSVYRGLTVLSGTPTYPNTVNAFVNSNLIYYNDMTTYTSATPTFNGFVTEEAAWQTQGSLGSTECDISVVFSCANLVNIYGYALYSVPLSDDFNYARYLTNPSKFSVEVSNDNVNWRPLVPNQPFVYLSSPPTASNTIMYHTHPLSSDTTTSKRFVKDSKYYPPDLRGSFLRGIGTYMNYSGANIVGKQMEAKGIQFDKLGSHSHNLPAIPAHYHTYPMFANILTIYYWYDGAGYKTKSTYNNVTVTDWGNDAFNSKHHYYDSGASYAYNNKTTNNDTTNSLETYPYNCGVNWIIKL
jgi:hypothetical protein